MGKPPSSRRGFEEIDQSLRRAYDEVVNEGVPERFSDLLKRLKDGNVPPPSEATGDE